MMLQIVLFVMCFGLVSSVATSQGASHAAIEGANIAHAGPHDSVAHSHAHAPEVASNNRVKHATIGAVSGFVVGAVIGVWFAKRHEPIDDRGDASKERRNFRIALGIGIGTFGSGVGAAIGALLPASSATSSQSRDM